MIQPKFYHIEQKNIKIVEINFYIPLIPKYINCIT